MSVNLLILPGIGNSDAEHWQTLWQASDPAFSRIPQAEWNAPQRADWVRQLEASLQEKGPDTILVAHSLSCLLVAHWAPTTRIKPRAALLVAPPDPAASVFPPEALSFAQPPMMPLGFPALLVASENDPYASLGFAQNCAAVCGKGAQSHRKCTDSDLHSCSCTDADESSGTPCSKDSVGGDSAVCVVGRPESGWTSGCTCATVSCKNTSSGCQCSNTGESPLGWQTCEPSGGALRCCLRLGNLGGFTCSCGDSKYSTCSSSEYELSSCSETAVTTALKNVLVDKCDN